MECFHSKSYIIAHTNNVLCCLMKTTFTIGPVNDEGVKLWVDVPPPMCYIFRKQFLSRFLLLRNLHQHLQTRRYWKKRIKLVRINLEVI
ncbi:hypothetical protein ACJMK2_036915 [Sinanodonta woodiana]|uniref:Uncharacterized protein n=1 Tax=Sinanodonta woodiana TaxID=1069815 RepID=A0ABD3WIN9_SINWO